MKGEEDREREREREGRSTRQGQMRLRRHNKLLSPQPKKNELNTCVHVSRGRQGPPPLHEMSTRRHHTISPSLSSPFTSHSTHMTCARFGFHLVLFWIICHLSGQHNTACLPVCSSVRVSVCFPFYFPSVCLALGPCN